METKTNAKWPKTDTKHAKIDIKVTKTRLNMTQKRHKMTQNTLRGCLCSFSHDVIEMLGLC